ncbi:hypothetical protein OJAV_G00064700 [Oryzias javanicus]|uniref:Uncharacterized protein n=1 Tax=Oryzias javanicus TaxID=123683 RepID=A0A3S2UGH4_ORYJA|nr:hypothetical protein OJAV_G00064700 [Oryzias javanicus]
MLKTEELPPAFASTGVKRFVQPCSLEGLTCQCPAVAKTPEISCASEKEARESSSLTATENDITETSIAPTAQLNNSAGKSVFCPLPPSILAVICERRESEGCCTVHEKHCHLEDDGGLLSSCRGFTVPPPDSPDREGVCGPAYSTGAVIHLDSRRS